MKAKRFLFKAFRNNKLIKQVNTHFIRRFGRQIRMLSYKKGPLRVHLYVYYGKSEDNFGKMVNFDNSGEYTTKKELLAAFKYFTEDGSIK